MAAKTKCLAANNKRRTSAKPTITTSLHPGHPPPPRSADRDRVGAGRRSSAAPLPALMRSHSMSTDSSKFFFGRSRFNMRLNGWQRLWLVGTVCLGLWLVGWWPLQLAGKTHDYYFGYRWELEKDFQNPQCRAYQTAPTRHADSSLPSENRAPTSLLAVDLMMQPCRTRWRLMIDTGPRSGGKPIFKPSPWGLLPPVFSAPSCIFVA